MSKGSRLQMVGQTSSTIFSRSLGHNSWNWSHLSNLDTCQRLPLDLQKYAVHVRPNANDFVLKVPCKSLTASDNHSSPSWGVGNLELCRTALLNGYLRIPWWQSNKPSPPHGRYEHTLLPLLGHIPWETCATYVQTSGQSISLIKGPPKNQWAPSHPWTERGCSAANWPSVPSIRAFDRETKASAFNPLLLSQSQSEADPLYPIYYHERNVIHNI